MKVTLETWKTLAAMSSEGFIEVTSGVRWTISGHVASFFNENKQ